MSLRLEDPRWLVLAGLAIPCAVIAWSWFTGMSGFRRWSAIVLRTLLMVCLALMVAGATVVRTTDRMAVIAVVDVSESVRRLASTGAPPGEENQPLARARAWLNTATARRGPDDLFGLLTFDSASHPLASARPPGWTAGVGHTDDLDSPTDPLARPFEFGSTEGTDIASALRVAQAMFPSDAARRIVLFSDGNQTTGDVLEAASMIGGGRAASRRPTRTGGTPVDVVPFSYRVSREVVVESLQVPTTAAAGAVVAARVTIKSTVPVRGVLTMTSEGRPVDINGAEPGVGKALDLPAGATTVVVNVPLDRGRVHRLEAVFEPDAAGAADTLTMNNSAQAVTVTPGTGSVLLVDGVGKGASDGAGAVLARTLREEQIEVDMVAAEGVPADLLKLEKYDLVMLANVPAEAVGEAGQRALVRYVSELGGGLVMIGGPESFGAGGWKGTPVEPILPVRLDLPEQLVVPAAAVIIVMDSSGSMGRTVGGSMRSQQEIANQGASVAVRSLDKTDQVGVIQFDHSPEVVVPLGPNSDAEATARAIRSIRPGGGTNLPPALQMAYNQIKASKASVKHVIVLSDGESQGRSRLVPMCEEMARDGIKVSAIAVGDEADRVLMEGMARAGGGIYYPVDNPNSLPRVFLKAVRLVRTPMVREVPFVPVVTRSGSPATERLTGPIPPLGGLVLTQARAEASAGELGGGPTGAVQTGGVTYAMITPQGEPVLAHWQVGLGQVAAFTSDASKWATEWIGWPGYSTMWTQLARMVARPQAGRSGELAAEVRDGQLRLRFDATDESGKAMENLRVPTAVYSPAGDRTDVEMSQVGPGQYEAVVPLSRSGAYVVTVSPMDSSGRRLPPVIGAAVKPAGDELRAMASNDQLLARVAEATGGRVLSLNDGERADLFDRKGVPPQEARLPLWPMLLPVAMVLLWLDVATRRVAWDRALSREFGATLRRDAAAAVKDRSAQAVRTLGGLRRSAPTDASGAALRGNEAEALVEEAKRRRRAAGGAGGAIETVNRCEPASPPEENSLMAAKRRARERMKEE